MSNKKKNSILFILLFFLMVLLPQIAGPFYFDEKKCCMEENRNLESFPDRFVWRKISRKLEAWYNDRLPFRAQILPFSRSLSGYFFPEVHQNLIHGTDGFYFYAKQNSSANTYAQYAGLERPRRFEILDIQGELRKTCEDAGTCGCNIVIFIPPNKIDIYPDKLPEKRKAKRSLLGWPEKLDHEMRKNQKNISFHYIRNELCEYRKRFPHLLYYPADTHWNFLGAYCGTKILFEKCGWNWPARWPLPEQAKLMQTGKNDPAELLFFTNYRVKCPCNPEFIVGNFTERPEKTTAIRGDQYFITEKNNAPDQREVIVFRDSFCVAMVPYISAYFRKVHFIWSKYNKAEVRRIKPDLIIYERIARHVYSF